MLSRRRFLARGLGLAATALLAACGGAIESVLPSASRPSVLPTAPATPMATPAATSPPPLRDVIGQMLLVGFRGTTPQEASATLSDIADLGLGGVILFSVDQPTGGVRNITSAAQLSSLTSALSAASRVPLIVAIDQEGGRVARLGPSHGFPATPSAAEMGRGNPSDTEAVARSMALTERGVGVTLNLAPVVDLALNPANPVIAELDRSFGTDPTAVSDQARAFIKGHHAEGLRCAIKHFPGQGSASGDTHLDVVDVTEDWSRAELEPFANLASDGSADAVLTAHIFNATLDPQYPATLSRSTISGILRGQLGWQGPVISDDLQMGAIRDAYGYAEAVALAIEAGVDLLLIANQVTYEPNIVRDTIDLVEGLVRDGRISEDRIRASVARVATLRR